MADLVSNLGLIGIGRWGRNYIPTIASVAEARLAVACSASAPPAGLLPPAVPLLRDWRALLAWPGLSGVIVATPPGCHVEITAAALRAGLAVLVEKPVALDLAAAEELERVVAETGGVLLVDHVRLFSPAYHALKRLVAEAGPIRSIQSVTGNPPGPSTTPVLWDLGPHDVAMGLDLVGAPPVAVTAEVVASGPARAAGTVRVGVTFADGTVAEHTVGNRFEGKLRRFAVRCAFASFVYDDAAPAVLVRHAGLGGRPEAIAVPPDPPLTCAVRALAALAQGRTAANPSPIALGVEVVRVLARAEQVCRPAAESLYSPAKEGQHAEGRARRHLR